MRTRRRLAAVASAAALLTTAGIGATQADILDNCDDFGNCEDGVESTSTETKTETKTIPGTPGSKGGGGGSGKSGGSGSSRNSGSSGGAGLSGASGGNPLTGSSGGSNAKPAAKAKPLTAAQKAAILNNNWREESLGDRNLGGCGDPDFPGVAATCPEPEPATAEPAAQTQPARATQGRPGTPARTVTTVTVDEVVERAKAKIKLPKPNIGSAPCTDANCKGTVGVPVWFWLDGDEWQTRTDTASAGGNTVRVTAKPSKVVWKLGDGQSVTCDGPGTEYSESKGWATSPDCGLKDGYKSAGKYSVTADITYDVTVTGDANESETVTRSSSEPLTVREIQTVIK